MWHYVASAKEASQDILTQLITQASTLRSSMLAEIAFNHFLKFQTGCWRIVFFLVRSSFRLYRNGE